MFYNNGLVFQSTFSQEINIPKLGENLAEVLNHIKTLYGICNYKFEKYKKIIFETEDISIIILKLGEDSNIALFFKKEEDKELKLTAIKRYITRIEELIDMDEKELILQEILVKEEEIKRLKESLNNNKISKEQLGLQLRNIEEGTIKSDKKKIINELNDLDIEYANIIRDIEKINTEITKLKEKIEKSH